MSSEKITRDKIIKEELEEARAFVKAFICKDRTREQRRYEIARDVFAAMVVGAPYANPDYETAVKAADGLLAELDKNPPKAEGEQG